VVADQDRQLAEDVVIVMDNQNSGHKNPPLALG